MSAFVEEEGRVLLFKRSATAGQLAGLWEFPAVDLDGGRPPEEQLAADFGGLWTLGEEIARLRHAITTRSFAIEVRRASHRREGSEEGLGAEAPKRELERDTVAEGNGGNGGPPGGFGAARAGTQPGWWGRDAASGLPLTGAARKILARAGGQPT